MPTADELCSQADQLKDEGKLDEAVVKYQAALDLEPENVLGHLSLSVLLTRLARHDEAIKHAYRATELEPNDAFGYTSLSVTLQRAGKFLEAEDALARAKMLQQGH